LSVFNVETVYWQAERALDCDDAVFAHVLGSQQRFRDDYVLGTPTHPTHTWEQGEVFKQTRRVIVPPGLAAGSYTVQIGVWSRSDHRPLRLGPWWHLSRAGDLLRITVSPDDSVPPLVLTSAG